MATKSTPSAEQISDLQSGAEPDAVGYPNLYPNLRLFWLLYPAGFEVVFLEVCAARNQQH